MRWVVRDCGMFTRDHLELLGQNAFVIDESSQIEYVIEFGLSIGFPASIGSHDSCQAIT